MNMVEKLAMAIVAAHHGRVDRVRELCLQCVGAIEPNANIDAMLETRFIDAVKMHRSFYGTTLKDARDACDARREVLRSQREPAPPEQRSEG